MTYRNHVDATLTQRVADLVSRQMARARMRRELCLTSDRALAELGLGRGDIDDVVDGTYRRAA